MRNTFNANMNANMIRKINDVVLYVLFCFLAGTGIMLEFSFVKGAGMQTVMSLTKHDWEVLHTIAGLIMIISTLLHLLLNAKFIKNALCYKRKSVLFAFVVLGLLLIFGLGFFPKKTTICQHLQQQTR